MCTARARIMLLCASKPARACAPSCYTPVLRRRPQPAQTRPSAPPWSSPSTDLTRAARRRGRAPAATCTHTRAACPTLQCDSLCCCRSCSNSAISCRQVRLGVRSTGQTRPSSANSPRCDARSHTLLHAGALCWGGGQGAPAASERPRGCGGQPQRLGTAAGAALRAAWPSQGLYGRGSVNGRRWEHDQGACMGSASGAAAARAGERAGTDEQTSLP